MMSVLKSLVLVPLMYQATWAAAYPRSANHTNFSSLLENFAFSPGTMIHPRGSEEFFNATERWTTFDAPSYGIAVSPATEEDVAKLVSLANQYHIPFLATGKRHGYTTTLGALQNGLAVDLSQLNSIMVNATAQTLTVGPGVAVGDIFDPLFAAGLDIQTGSAPCPSLIGVTLGGGVGRYQGVYGLIIDALVSVRIATADGRVLEASSDINQDLFWGIRGAGANLGVVTSATYKAHPLTNDGNNYVVEYVIPPNRVAEFFETVESMQPLPAPLASIILNNFNATTNQTQLAVEWVYKGPEEEAQKALQPIFDLDLDVTRLDPYVKWNVLINSAFGGGAVDAVCANNITRDLYSWNMNTYSAATFTQAFAKVQDFFAQYPGARNSVLQYEYFPNQAMAAVPLNDTAFRWRDSTGYMNFNILFDDEDTATKNAAIALGQEVRTLMSATSGYPELTVFVSYAHGDEGLDRIYGAEKLPRLAELKRRYDPNHVFSFNNGIPSHYP